MKKFDIAIRCGHLLSMKEDASGKSEAVKQKQLIGIVGSKIVYVGDDAENAFEAKEWINAQDKIVMPGMVNGHCHLPMSLFRGLADDLGFQTWFFDYILPLERRLVSPEFVRLGTQVSAIECIRSGTTTVCDMYFYENEIARTWDKAGLRGFLGESITDFDAPDNKNRDGEPYKILEDMLKDYGDSDRIQVALAPHAPYSCSNATLKEVMERARAYNVPMTIHVSETKAEVEDSLKQYKKTPVERLQEFGFLDHRCVFAHCVHLTDSDMNLMANSQASAIHNPESNAKLGVGIARVRKMIDCKICMGLGTDGPASNNNLNMFTEMDMAAKLQKLQSGDSSGMTAIESLKLATLGGARALGMGEVTGSIEVGKFADIVVVDTDSAHMQPLHDVRAQLVYSATGGEVSTVLCHGKILLKDRVLSTLDEKDVLKQVAQYRQRENF